MSDDVLKQLEYDDIYALMDEQATDGHSEVAAQIAQFIDRTEAKLDERNKLINVLKKSLPNEVTLRRPATLTRSTNSPTSLFTSFQYFLYFYYCLYLRTFVPV